MHHDYVDCFDTEDLIHVEADFPRFCNPHPANIATKHMLVDRDLL